MAVFLTPEAKPVFGGTYLPARDGDRGAQMGFFTLLKRIDEFWTTKRENIEQDADTITTMVKNELDGRRPQAVGELDDKIFHEAFHAFEEQYDPDYGGFGYDKTNPFRPKFPEPSNVAFVIDRLKSGDLDEEHQATARKLVVGTLEHMAEGLQAGGADAVLAASIFHFGTFTIAETKAYLAEQGIPVRTC